MTIITNSGVRGTLPRTMCLTCISLMWLECALGLCLVCELNALLVKRGLTRGDSEVEICAHGLCELPARTRAGPAGDAARGS